MRPLMQPEAQAEVQVLKPKRYARAFGVVQDAWRGLAWREKILLVVAITAACHLVIARLWVQPLQSKLALQASAHERVQLKLFERSAMVAATSPLPEPERAKQMAELEGLRERLRELQLIQAQVSTHPEADMAEWLQRAMRTSSADAGLLGARTLPPVKLSAQVGQREGAKKPAASAKAETLDVTVNTLELDLRGTYLGLLAQLQALEAVDDDVLWSAVTLTKSPAEPANMRLVMQLLSAQKEQP